jgi:BirA family biotin operon repressor/biotin-[acetyl-CoA-carboxylase] ligase
VAGHDIDREEVLVAILEALDARHDDGHVVDDARARSATLGTRVRVHLASEVVDGVAVALTDAGHLVVDTGAGPTRTITTGDVVHLRPG